MSKKLRISLLVVLGLAGIAAGAKSYIAGKNKGIPVIVGTVKTGDVVSKVTANGKIQAENRVELSALVMGQITNLVVKEGDRVKRGDFLLQIDRGRAAADEAGSAAALRASEKDRDSARTTMEQAERDFVRSKSNFEAKISSEAEFQKARTVLEGARDAFAAAQHRVDQTKASLAASRDTLQKTTIVAPIDGIITTLRVKAGEVTVIGTMNNPGTQLMTISDMSTVQAVLMVDETDTTAVQVGQKALLTIDAYPGQTFEGRVTEVGNSPILRDDPDLSTLTTTSDAINFKVKVNLLSPPARIRPGFSVTADIITGTRKNVSTVPLASVVIRDSPKGERTEAGTLKTEEGVYALKSGKASFVPVKTGLSGELLVELLEGPQAGSEIVAGPFKALRQIKDGDAVKAMTDKEKKAAEKEGAEGS
ncbi:MAG: efflux RND transporter periplasmic adaptor subunit [Acidobacteria bacterium]|nr:efflux RND transporter periplasmic adaptor subunit [Acidobacteriota bacterium]MCK6682108.1 efflux RND transporter periplasmic adaptor subunit [Thermoanaerobaculia bacterium]